MTERVTLTGRFVRLEPLTMAHAAGLAAAATERSTYAYTWVPDGLAGAEQYIGDALAEEAAGRQLPFATIRLDGAGGTVVGGTVVGGTVVGTTRFMDTAPWRWGPEGAGRQRVGVPDTVEIGSTWLAASAQRSAVNTEAKLLMLGHAFDVWGVHAVRLKTDARNDRSRTAIARLGATFEGVLRAHMPASDGTVRDTAMFSITAAEWPGVRADLEARLAGGPSGDTSPP